MGKAVDYQKKRVQQSEAESDEQSEERAGGKAVDKWKKTVVQFDERVAGKAVDKWKKRVEQSEEQSDELAAG